MGWSNHCGAKGDRSFGRGITETSGIARRTRGVKEKIRSYKSADPKTDQLPNGS